MYKKYNLIYKEDVEDILKVCDDLAISGEAVEIYLKASMETQQAVIFIFVGEEDESDQPAIKEISDDGGYFVLKGIRDLIAVMTNYLVILVGFNIPLYEKKNEPKI